MRFEKTKAHLDKVAANFHIHSCRILSNPLAGGWRAGPWWPRDFKESEGWIFLAHIWQISIFDYCDYVTRVERFFFFQPYAHLLPPPETDEVTLRRWRITITTSHCQPTCKWSAGLCTCQSHKNKSYDKWKQYKVGDWKGQLINPLLRLNYSAVALISRLGNLASVRQPPVHQKKKRRERKGKGSVLVLSFLTHVRWERWDTWRWLAKRHANSGRVINFSLYFFLSFLCFCLGHDGSELDKEKKMISIKCGTRNNFDRQQRENGKLQRCS